MTYNFASIDIETTGLNPDIHQILEIGIVLDNLQTKVSRDELDDYVNSLPTLNLFLDYQTIVGNPYALSMLKNQTILKAIAAKGENVINPQKVHNVIADFFLTHGLINDYIHESTKNNKVLVAGKNFGIFDLQFLNKLEGFKEGKYFKFHHRVIDPTMLYMVQEDTVPPNLQTCLQRAGIESMVAHRAVDDAKDVIKLLKLRSLPYLSGNMLWREV